MSFNQIIEELPKLSLEERRQLTRQLIELEPDRECLETCDRLSDEAMQVLDRTEEEDVRRSTQG
jgi:hypothetical protein